MTRQHGNRGAILKRPVGPFFEDYITDHEALPTAPLDVDHVTDVSHFYMYANGPDPSAPTVIAPTGVSNCTCVGAAEFFNVTSAFSGIHPGGVHFMTMNVIMLYEAFGYVLGQPNTDNGAELTQVAAYLTNHNLIDDQGRPHQLAGWAQLEDPTNPWTLRRVINLFGAVYMGYCLPDSAMQDFNDEQAWTNLSDPADPNEGHCMLYSYSDLQRWTESADTASGKDITWGASQGLSPNWNSKYGYQALALVTNDYITKNGTTVQGLNLAQMLSDSKDVSH
jgi:hypothetical protein